MRTLLLLVGVVRMHGQIVFPPDLSISRLEVVQTIQDDAHTVPLIAGKATAVRAFVRQQQRPESLVGGVTVFLRGFRGGSEINGSPLRAVNGPISAALQPDRANASHSLDFILPAEWTAAGGLELRAELRLPPTTSEGPADNNTLRREIEFIAPATSELRVYWLPVCPSGAACSPAGFQHQHLAQRLLPLADGTMVYEDVPAPALALPGGVSTEAESQTLLNLLRRWRLLLEDSPLRAHHVIGWLPRGAQTVTVAARSVSDRVAWVAEQEAAISNQRLLLQQLVTAVSSGGCEEVIREPGFDLVGGRIVPANRNRVLSRCDPAQVTPWLSAADARTLTVAAENARSASSSDAWIISGTIRRDGSGVLDAAYPVSTVFAPRASDDTREACLLVTAGGNDTTRCFVPFQDSADNSGFAFRIPSANVTSVRLLINGVEAASLSSTGQAPSINITSVREGDSWSGARSLQWTASDPSGRPLTYAVFYSNDEGANWIPLALDLRETQFNIDTQYLLPGAVRFRVLASAGLDVGEAIAGPVGILRAPRLVLPDNTLNFGNATTGQIAERGLPIQNAGASPLELTIASPPGESFRFSAPPPFGVRAGTERNVALQYRPRIPGQESSEFTLNTSDPDAERLTISLRANAFERLVPNALISPRMIDFGQVQVGQTREMPFVVRNDGTAPLTITSLSTLNARFAAVSPAGTLTIPPGEERVLLARFVPLASGQQTGTLNVATNDPTTPTLRAELRGAGVQVFTPVADVSASRVEFGFLALGQTSPILPVTVRNAGNGPLTIISLAMTNPAFAVLSPSTLPVNVQPGAQQVISLRFAPSAAGPQTGTLTIENSDPARPRVTVDLSGTGTPQAPSSEPRITYVSPVTLRPVPTGYSNRFNITVVGSNFAPGARILWNGSERPTELLSTTIVRGSLSPQDVESPREAEVSVANPPPGGGTSSPYSVLVTTGLGAAPSAQIHEVGLTACPTVTFGMAVTNRIGLGITSLNSSNLRCLEDGQVVPCAVRSALAVDNRLAAVMVMHTSASISDRVKRTRDVGFMQRVGLQFVEALHDSSQLQVTYMETGVQTSPSTPEFKDGVNKGALRDAINGIATTIPIGSSTALYDAIEDGLDRLAAQTNRRKALILFTASENTYDVLGPRNLNTLFQRAQHAGIPLFLIPVGDGIQNSNLISLLHQFASDSGGRVLIDRGSSISEEVNRLAHELDNMHLVDFTTLKRDGQPHKIQVNFTVSDGVFSTAKVYQGCPAR